MEIKYEITMYKLLIIFLISVFLALGLGGFFGAKLGFSDGVDAVTVKAPEYCSVQKIGTSAELKCIELNMSAEDLCSTLSPSIERQLKILVVE